MTPYSEERKTYARNRMEVCSRYVFVEVCTLLWYTKTDNLCLTEIRNMDERNYRLWMEKNKSYHTARTYTARCMRVEAEMKIDLDEQFLKDGGKTLMMLLKYSREEERKGIKPKCGISFEGASNIYGGMNALRAAVKKYFEYKRQVIRE